MEFLNRLKEADEQIDQEDYAVFLEIVALVTRIVRGEETGTHDPVEIMRRLPAQYDFAALQTEVRNQLATESGC